MEDNNPTDTSNTEENKPTEEPTSSEQNTEQPQISEEQKKEAGESTEIKQEEKSKLPEDEKILSAIGYLGVLCVLPLFLKPKSEYCQFHGKQGLLMLLIWIAFLILFAALPRLGGVIFFLFLLLIIFSMYNAYVGKKFKIPILGDISDKIDLNKALSGISGTTAAKPEEKKGEPEETPEQPEEKAKKVAAEPAVDEKPDEPVAETKPEEAPVEEIQTEEKPQAEKKPEEETSTEEKKTEGSTDESSLD